MARKRKKSFLITIICFLAGVFYFFFCGYNSSDYSEFLSKPSPKISDLKEDDYVKMYCTGQREYMLSDRTRVDCLTDEYAIEYDWAKKWAESIGQSMYYSKMTGKKPAVAIIIKNPYERIYIDRIKKANPDIKIFEIKSENYSE